jgi:hypothetical protein
MTIFEIVISVFLTLFAFSLGLNLSHGKSSPRLVIFDILLVIAIWISLFVASSNQEVLLIHFIALSFLAAFVFGLFRKSRQSANEIYAEGIIQGISVWQKIKMRWISFAGRLGGTQSRMILGLFYFFVFTPFGIISRVFSNPIQKKKVDDRSYWTIKDHGASN